MNNSIAFATLLIHLNKETNVSPEDFEKCKSFFRIINAAQGEVIIRPGETVHEQYFIVEGCVRVYHHDLEHDRDYTLLFGIEEWWISDFIAYHLDLSSGLYVECTHPSTLIAISKNDLHELYNTVPAFESFFRQKLERAFAFNHQRILSLQKDSGEQRYLDFISQYPNIEQRVKNYQIASYLGIAPESLSRIRNQLAKK